MAAPAPNADVLFCQRSARACRRGEAVVARRYYREEDVTRDGTRQRRRGRVSARCRCAVRIVQDGRVPSLGQSGGSHRAHRQAAGVWDAQQGVLAICRRVKQVPQLRKALSHAPRGIRLRHRHAVVAGRAARPWRVARIDDHQRQDSCADLARDALIERAVCACPAPRDSFACSEGMRH